MPHAARFVLASFVLWLPLACAHGAPPSPAVASVPSSPSAAAPPTAGERMLVDPQAWPQLSSALAGSWRGPDDRVRLESLAIANGSALLQRWRFAGGGETIDVFFADGEGMGVTHYCNQGNQATLQAVAREGDAWVFEQRGVTNFLAGSSALCRLSVRVQGDALTMDEQYCDATGTPVGAPERVGFTRMP